jgi:DNA polymerase I
MSYLVNIASKNSKIYLFERLGDELHISEDDTFKQFYFEPSDTGKYTAYDGTKLRKIEVSNPYDVKKYRSQYSYSSDIHFTKNYMIHKLDKLEKSYYKYLFMDIELLAKDVPNVNTADQPVSCVSFFNNYNKEVKTFWLQDYQGNILQREKKLFDDMLSYIVQEKPDILLGWNFVNFDYTYIYNRYKVLYGNSKNLAEIISPINLSHSGNSEFNNIENPCGISIMDYMMMFKKVFMREPSYTLDAICQKYLKDESWGSSDFSKLTTDIRDKNVNDVLRLAELEDKFNLFEYFDEIRRLTKTEWEDLLMNSVIVENLLMQKAKIKGIVLPNKPQKSEDDEVKFEGAARDVTKTGASFDLGKFDLGSAYPNMMVNFCLDSSNIVDDGSGLELNGFQFQQDPDALIPSMVKDILILKDTLKAELKKVQPKSAEAEALKIKYNAIKGVVNCFSPDTDILTVNGPRSIKDVKVGDKVYNVNPKTLKVEIDTVIATQEEDYNGKMYHYTNGANLKVTEDHRFLVKYRNNTSAEFKTISELYKETDRHRYSVPTVSSCDIAKVSEEFFSFFDLLCKYDGDVYIIPSHENRYKLRSVYPKGFSKVFTVKETCGKIRKGWKRAKAKNLVESEILDLHKSGWDVRGRITPKTKMSKVFVNRKEWLKFLGWYISEGSHYKSKRKEYSNTVRGEAYSIGISQSLVHPAFRKEIELCLNALGCKVRIGKKGFSFSSEMIFLYLDEEVLKYSQNKKIPDFVFLESLENMRILFDSLYKGDGNQRDRRYNTSSKTLSEQVARLLLLFGTNKVRIREKSSNRYSKGKFYRVSWGITKRAISKKFITTEDYNGKVYCVTTTNGTVYAGRKGFFSLTGQSAFGAIGFPSFRLYDSIVASTITWLVRDVLRYTREEVKKLGYEAIYHDTDSVFLTCKDDISDKLNGYIQDWAKLKGKDSIDLKYEYEGYFSKIFIIALCRYIGYLETPKGTVIETKGAEAKRADSSQYVRIFQPKLIDKILDKETKESLIKWIREEKQRIKTLPIEEIAIPCKLPTKEYGGINKNGGKKGIPIFVRAINNTNSFKKLKAPVGEVIWWAYVVPKHQDVNGKDVDVLAFTMNDKEVIKNHSIDWDRMVERNIMSKVNTIFEANGWSTFELDCDNQFQLF